MTAAAPAGPAPAASARPRRAPGRARRLALLAAAAAALAVAWAALVPAGRVAVRTLLFMPDLMPPVAVRPLTWVTRDPVRTEVRIAPSVGPSTPAAAPPTAAAPPSAPAAAGWAADVYVPAGRGPFPAIVVSLGINQAARDDPRVRKLGDGLARLGFVVVIPANDDLRAERLTPDAVAMLVAAFDHLAARPDVDRSRIGLFGVCIGASLALLAAEEASIAGDVAWVAWFGGYHRLETLIAAVVSRSRPRPAVACPPGAACPPPGTIEPWAVDPLSERVVRAALAAWVAPSADGPGGADVGAAAARALLARGATYDEALRALASLPPAARARLAALSPATRLDALRAPLYTMSDVGDPLVPSSETDALNRDAAALGRLARARTFDVFSHVNLDPFADPARTLPEVWRLYRHVHAIVAPALLD